MNEFFGIQEFTAKTQPVTKWTGFCLGISSTLEHKPPKDKLTSFLRKVKLKNDSDTTDSQTY